MRVLRSTISTPGGVVRGRALALAAAFTLVASATASALGGGLPRYLAAADAGIADLIGARSPGERRSAELTKTKTRAVPRLDVGRVARALPRLRNAVPAAAPAGAPILPAAAAAPLLAPTVAEAAPGYFPGETFAALPPGSGGFGFAPGGFFPGIGGFGGGGGGVIIQPPAQTPEEAPQIAPQTAPPGVPEPTSWTMLILGFGLAGASLRKGRLALHRA